jgi:hypothetical protein
MSREPNPSGVGRREFIAGAGGVAAAGYLAIGGDPTFAHSAPAPAPAKTWMVAIDATQGPPFGYTEPTLTTPNTAGTLPVNPSDIVTWKISAPAHKRHTVIFFKDKTPFVDSKQNPVWWFHGSKADEPIGGKGVSIDKNVLPGADFCYTVIVFDEDAGQTHLDDPKILIATVLHGEAQTQARKEVITAEQKLLKARQEINAALESLGSARKNLDQTNSKKSE